MKQILETRWFFRNIEKLEWLVGPGAFSAEFAQDMMCMRSGAGGVVFGYTSDWKILSLKNHGLVLLQRWLYEI